MRIIRVIKKELLELGRDNGFIATLIIMPIILILVMGYTFQADLKNIDTAIIDDSVSEYSEKVLEALSNSEYFNGEVLNITFDEAKNRLDKGQYRAIFYIPPDFGAKLAVAERAEVQLYLDSSDYTVYNILKGASGTVMKDSLQEIVKIIVEDLEDERVTKQTEVDGIQSLVDGLEDESEETISNIEKMNLDGALDSLDDLENSLEQLKTVTDPAIHPSIDEIISEVGDSKSDINSQKKTLSDTNETAYDIKETYEEIQERLNHVHLELRALKKDFLSFPFDIKDEYAYGEISYFQYLTPAIITLILFFIGFVLTTLNLIEERNTKTLFRISVTPLKKIELFGGKFFVYFLIGFLEVLYVLLIAKVIFNIEVAGSYWDVIAVLTLLISSAIGIGLMISSKVKTMRQASMFLPLIVITLLLISQTFSPKEVMPWFMRYFAYLSPLYYSNVALREIMIRGIPLSELYTPLIILGGFALLSLIIGIAWSKKRIE